METLAVETKKVHTKIESVTIELNREELIGLRKIIEYSDFGSRTICHMSLIQNKAVGALLESLPDPIKIEGGEF